MDPELSRLMGVLDQATGRLSESFHRIATLQAEVAAKDRALAQRSRLEMLGRMAATLAHEIRNPLGGIQISAALLRRDAGDPGSRESCDRILLAVAQLDRLVDDMLTYGRDTEPLRLPNDPGALIDETLALSGLEQRLRVERHYALRNVRCDADLLRRAFLNLAMNAAQAMDGGTLTVETAEDGGFARIVFRDTGPGIPEDVLPRLFTPFLTTRARGTGLGLAIARKLVESHGGTIAASNVAPHGAQFVIRLPL